MRFHAYLLSTLFAAIALIAGLSGAKAESTIFTQAPCAPSFDGCVIVAAYRPSTVVARTRTITVPGPGMTVVQFHGILFCDTNGTGPEPPKFSLTTQITEGNAAPDGFGPGGMFITQSIPPAGVVPGGSGYITSTTVNLASTRAAVIPAAGTYTYRFRIRRVVFPNTIVCRVHNGTFTITFTPRR